MLGQHYCYRDWTLLRARATKDSARITQTGLAERNGQALAASLMAYSGGDFVIWILRGTRPAFEWGAGLHCCRANCGVAMGLGVCTRGAFRLTGRRS